MLLNFVLLLAFLTILIRSSLNCVIGKWNARLVHMYKLSGFLHIDIVKYQRRAAMWSFLTSERSERATRFDIVSSCRYVTISIRRKSDYLFIVLLLVFSLSLRQFYASRKQAWEHFLSHCDVADSFSSHIVTSLW